MLAFPLPRRSFASSLNKFPTPTQTFASGSKQPLLQWNTKRVSYFSTSSETPSTPPPSSPPSPPSSPSSLPPATTEKPEEEKKNMFPKELVKELNRFIVGQEEAKIAIANAFRNRWRRLRVPQPLRDEIVPKNILMVGPTGVGKTEIARRMAKLTDAPFIKVEATKFTEVGYVGKDVDTIIRDLVDIAVNQAKQKMRKKLRPALEQAVEDKILEILTGEDPRSATRELFRDQLRSGALDSQIIEIETKGPSPNFKVDEGSSPVNFVMKMPVVKKKMTVKESRAALEEQELEKRFNSEAAVQQALVSVQEEGIVFIDEIDKVCTPTSQMRHSDASAEGVQRDLLPLIEGTTINTKYGNVDTSKILFVASGAFHSCKPSDLLAELQGRLPIRVELKGLSEKDLFRILREPETNLLRQQQLMMEVEKIQLTFTDEAVTEIARFSAQLNSTIENIGARRLHMVLEKIMEQVSFDCETPREVVIDLQYVQNALSPLMQKIDLTKYLL